MAPVGHAHVGNLPGDRKFVRTALVHDWLTGMRGGEKVLEMLCELYPTADLYTLIHRRGSTSPTIERMHPRTSWLQRLPGINRYYRVCLPLFPFVIEQFDLGGSVVAIHENHRCHGGDSHRPNVKRTRTGSCGAPEPDA